MITGTADEIIMRLLPIRDSSKRYDLKEHREKRSLTQNAYYWVLVSKIAEKTRLSAARVHNMNLRACRYPLVVDGKIAEVFLPDTSEAEEKAIELDSVHLAPCGNATMENESGERYRAYMILRGSHEMSTAEMAHLLDVAIQEAKQQDIETLPPDELERMRKMAQERENRKNA